jgi:hypothetical protein
MSQPIRVTQSGRLPRAAGGILIVEPNPTGHRLNFVRLIVERAIALGLDFTVALGPGAQQTEEYAAHLADLDLGPTMVVASHDLGQLRALARDSSAAAVVVPNGDELALALGRGRWWGSPARLSILVERATAQPARVAALDPVKKLARLAMLLAAAVQPNVRITLLTTSWRTRRRAFRTVGDPIRLNAPLNGREQFRAAHGMSPDTYWFGVLGAVDERKNVDVVARAMLAAPSRAAGLLIAGKIQPAVQSKVAALEPALTAAGIQLSIVDRMLTDVELDECVIACDCLIFAHANEGPSGIFGKALLAGTRALAAGSKWLRADARAVPANADWVALDVASLATGVAAAAATGRPQPVQLPGEAAFVDALL